ncbi:uncharacterized protein LOC106155596 [Lingula anatina]|uniref:Uncharacterized protein LOC106155596 n=1 Tax=Lingula anatina TaxID=7574 RepID=A0A1S3HIK2_LINAN|nr:uncharacterized protein LOC106155596 [Lingula anatina]|eukprot:XP_013385945.1 uncharacterized protein LOC106155596 [Lingula anatina]
MHSASSEEKRLSGQKGKYWLSNFASLANDPFVRNTTTGEQWLRFKHEGNHRVVVQVEINADRLSVVKGELLLQIIKVVIVNGKSSTTIKTDVFNRGIVSTRFTIKLVNCSLSKKTIKAATVGPRQLHSFHYSGKLTKHSEAKECQVVVVGHKHAVVARRTIKMKKGSRCVCLANCQCKCMSESLVCEPLSEADYHMAGFTGPVPRRQHLYRQLPFGAKTTINTVLAVVIALLSLGILKAWVGIMVSRRVAAFGLCLFTRNVQKLNAYYEQELQEIAVEYNQFGEPVNPLTKKPVSKMSLTTELFLNMIFFLYLPFVWVHWLFIKCVSVQRRPAAGDKLPNSPDSDPSTGAESADRGPLSRQSLDRHFTLQQFRKQKVKLKKGLNCGILLENENNNNSADACSNEGVFISTPGDRLDSRNVKRRRRAKKSSEKEDNTGKNPVDLYTLPGQLIYYNFTKAKMKPKNSGAKFSLCGTLEKFGEEYVFDVGDHNVQVVEVVKGKEKILHSLRLIDADYFKRTIKLTEVAKHISNRPLYPCLNIQDL